MDTSKLLPYLGAGAPYVAWATINGLFFWVAWRACWAYLKALKETYDKKEEVLRERHKLQNESIADLQQRLETMKKEAAYFREQLEQERSKGKIHHGT